MISRISLINIHITAHNFDFILLIHLLRLTSIASFQIDCRMINVRPPDVCGDHLFTCKTNSVPYEKSKKFPEYQHLIQTFHKNNNYIRFRCHWIYLYKNG